MQHQWGVKGPATYIVRLLLAGPGGWYVLKVVAADFLAVSFGRCSPVAWS